MKKILKPLSILAFAAAMSSCGGAEAVKTPAEILKDRISGMIADGQTMFGHQDDLMYGHTWRTDGGDFTRSDVREVCGFYPAVYGLDLGGIELANETNLDKNPFSQMRASAVAHHERGGIVTFSWHPRNPLTGGDAWDVSSDKVVASILEGGEKHACFIGWLSNAADFLESLKTAGGELIPVIFRPWHEHTGSWFWWGRGLCTPEEYKALWKMTWEYMTVERGLDNLVWSFSPGSGGLTEDIFMERWPGDEMVDMIGTDCYHYGSPEEYTAELRNALDILVKFGAEHGKTIALTETGCEGIPDAEWWTGTLAPAIKGYPLSYVLTWRNAPDMPGHFYAPFPGQASAEDFKAFIESENIRML